jgi:Domain of unknown function (DUF6907)
MQRDGLAPAGHQGQLADAGRASGDRSRRGGRQNGALMEAEVVRPLDGVAVALRPCPPWCAEARHFTDGEVIYADDGYHHYGHESEVPTSCKFLGMTDGPDTIIRAVLKSWTHPLDADPGPTLIELNLGTATERTDMCAEITPAEARVVAKALLDLAATAERDGLRQAPPGLAPTPAAGGNPGE